MNLYQNMHMWSMPSRTECTSRFHYLNSIMFTQELTAVEWFSTRYLYIYFMHNVLYLCKQCSGNTCKFYAFANWIFAYFAHVDCDKCCYNVLITIFLSFTYMYAYINVQHTSIDLLLLFLYIFDNLDFPDFSILDW